MSEPSENQNAIVLDQTMLLGFDQVGTDDFAALAGGQSRLNAPCLAKIGVAKPQPNATDGSSPLTSCPVAPA